MDAGTMEKWDAITENARTIRALRTALLNNRQVLATVTETTATTQADLLTRLALVEANLTAIMARLDRIESAPSAD